MKTLKYCILIPFILLIASCGSDDDDDGGSENNIVVSFIIPSGDIFENTTVSFTNTSTNASSYNWDFGDGNSSTTESPSHNYSSAGSYTVKLTASNADGASKDVSKSITIKETPTVLTSLFDISPGPYVNRKDIVLTNNSIRATSYLWDFGDGNTSTEESPTIQYASDGNYVIKLTAFDDTGQTSVSQRPLEVTKNPDLLIGTISAPSSVQYGETFTVQIAGNFSSVRWDMGDGLNLNLQNILFNYTYNTPDSYTITATISDGVNEKMITKEITARLDTKSWNVRLSGLALSHGSGVGGEDDGVHGLIEFDVVEIDASGNIVNTIFRGDNLWETAEPDRIQATGYPSNNSIIGNLNITRSVELDETKRKQGRYRVDYTTKLAVRHKDNFFAAWGTISMGTEKTKSFIIENEGVVKGDLFETDSDAGRIHFFRLQFVLS